MKRLNEEGLTLVEALAVVVISSIIIIFTGSLIVQSMKNQERISVEVQLRDEADIIMSKLIKDLFTLKESEIERVECGTVTTGSVAAHVSCLTEDPALSVEDLAKVQAAKQAMITCSQTENCVQYAFVYLKDMKKIGFQGDTIFTKNEQFTISNKYIELSPFYTLEMKKFPQTGTGINKSLTSIIVTFQLSNEKRTIAQTFQNEVITVDDE